ncbi:2og-fe oxygenase [Favolaschia claudopus]|uniref:2og-fe oxygenase n=1 Tax=Favolaschia claudopus TaxID=2862362 RepID=A0AAW0CVL0_9AGAR
MTGKKWEINHAFPLAPPKENLKLDEFESDSSGSEPEDSLDEQNSLNQDGSENASDDEKTTRMVKDYADMSALAKALELFNFKGLFMQTERYTISSAANPCLEIEGMGSIGLPLSSGVAASFLTNSGATAFEVGPDKICFQNPDWDTWLDKEAGRMCSELAGQAVKPVHRLRSLVLESPVSGHVFPDLAPDCAARLVVYLPSSFTGGQLRCRHGMQSKAIDFSSESQFHTSMLAAYSGVHLVQDPITSGYRLSLLYDIVDTTQSIPPFPDIPHAASVLEQAVVKWNDDEDERDFTAYFLQRSYPMKKITTQCLSGSDALLVAHLNSFTEELDFRLYIVQVGLYQSRYGEYDGYSGEKWDEVDPRRVKDLEEYADPELRHTVVYAIDTESVPVDIFGVDFGNDDESDDLYLNGQLTDTKPDSKYDLFDQERIRVDESYERTAILLVKNNRDDDMVWYPLQYAVSALQGSVSANPDVRENLLLRTLCEERPQKGWSGYQSNRANFQKKDLEDIPRVLCKCACQWSDLDLLLTTLETYEVASNLALMGVDRCIVALRTFGWESLKDFFEKVVHKDESNIRRQELALQLGEVAKQTNEKDFVGWTEAQPEVILKTLNRCCFAEIDWLLGLGTSHGAAFLRDTVYPQLENQTLESDFWVHFITKFKKHPISELLPSEFVDGCVSQAVNNLPAFPEIITGSNLPSQRQLREPNPRSIVDVLKLCAETENLEFCLRILNKMKLAAKRAQFSVECPPWKYYLELTSLLNAALNSEEASKSEVYYDYRPFFEETIPHILLGRTYAAPCPFSTENLAILVIAIKRGGGFAAFEESKPRAMLSGRDSQSVQKLTRYLIGSWPQSEYRTELVKMLVRQAIDVFDMDALHQPASKDKPSVTIDDMIALLRFCFEVDARSELQHLLLHFVAPPTGISISQHISQVLEPLMSPLHAYIAIHGLSLETPPFAKYSANIVKAYAATFMSQTPADIIGDANIGCEQPKCDECRILRGFFSDHDEQTMTLARAAKLREHIEKQLALLPKIMGVTYKLIKSDHGAHKLEIVKAENLTASGLWAQNSKRGKDLLALLGDEVTQRRIMGLNYETVVTQISERRTSSAKRSQGDEDDEDEPIPSAKKART